MDDHIGRGPDSHNIVSDLVTVGIGLRDAVDGNEIRYDIVTVRTSPYMIVHWALQYGTSVEILDEEIREKIREELKEMGEKYEK